MSFVQIKKKSSDNHRYLFVIRLQHLFSIDEKNLIKVFKEYFIFSTGRMVCTGAKNEADSRLAARKYARIIQKIGFQVNIFLNFIIYLNNQIQIKLLKAKFIEFKE